MQSAVHLFGLSDNAAPGRYMENREYVPASEYLVDAAQKRELRLGHLLQRSKVAVEVRCLLVSG